MHALIRLLYLIINFNFQASVILLTASCNAGYQLPSAFNKLFLVSVVSCAFHFINILILLTYSLCIMILLGFCQGLLILLCLS